MRTGAVHLELAEHLFTNSFINALVRFKNRKYQPLEIFCDNGTNFVGGSSELKQWLIEWQDSGEIEAACCPLGIMWRFNQPGASHKAGIVESLIHPVRRILEAISHENKIAGVYILDFT